MKAHNKILITVNGNHLDNQKDRKETVLWLHNVMPVIMQERKAATEKIFLHATQRITNFYLS